MVRDHRKALCIHELVHTVELHNVTFPPCGGKEQEITRIRASFREMGEGMRGIGVITPVPVRPAWHMLEDRRCLVMLPFAFSSTTEAEAATRDPRPNKRNADMFGQLCLGFPPVSGAHDVGCARASCLFSFPGFCYGYFILNRE